MRIGHLTRRTMAIAAAIVFVLCAAHAEAQTQQDGAALPFLPKGISGNPEEFFEQMFGKSTTEEAKELEAVKIPLREEREYGQPQVEAYLEQLKVQGLRVVRKGRDVEYLKQLVETIRPYLKNA